MKVHIPTLCIPSCTCFLNFHLQRGDKLWSYLGFRGLYEFGVVGVELFNGQVEGNDLPLVAIEFAKMDIDEAFQGGPIIGK